MIDLFEVDNLTKLSEVKGEPCISIYIPAHEEGHEVNQDLDRITFKNELQKIGHVLEDLGFQNRQRDNLLTKAWDLVGDVKFWKNQSSGLAAFITGDFFEYYRLPVTFNHASVVSSGFILTPLIPVLQLQSKFFILRLNKYEFKLYECTMSDIREVGIEDELRKRVEEALAPFEYKNDVYFPATDNTMDPLNPSRKQEVLTRAKENGDANIPEFFRLINEIVMMKLKNEEAPLIVAAQEQWHGDFRKVNKYKNMWEQGYYSNAQFLSERELHENVIDIIRPYFERPKQNALLRYQALGGSGRTSYDPQRVIFDAYAGRVESLFVQKDSFLWGRFDPMKATVEIENSPGLNNYCLLNYASVTTLKNNGMVYVLDKEEMPDNAQIAAVYRY